MTREEAKTVFLNRGYVEVEGGTIYDADKWRESCRVISEWLEQEPCDDAISREDVINLKWRGEASEEFLEGYANAIEDARVLPSVKPQKSKTGHWIFDEILDKHYYCSECKSMGVDYWDYCPYCGCRMVEPQESEE